MIYLSPCIDQVQSFRDEKSRTNVGIELLVTHEQSNIWD